MSKNWPLHQRLVIEGTTVGGDVWATGLNTIWGSAPGLQISFADQEALLKTTTITGQTGIAGLVSVLWDGVAGQNGQFGSVFSLVAVKFNAVGHDGKYVYPNTSEYQYTPAVPGSMGTRGVDPRGSLVVSLRAAYERGRGAYGRMYPPNTGILPATGSPYVSATEATAYMGLFHSLITSINSATASGEQLTVVNVSPGDTVAGTSSVVAPVTRIEVDRVKDTQRRRTNRIPRQAVAVAI